MGAFVDITGNRYARLVVIARAPNKNGRMRWLCKCDCGNTTEVRGEHLKNMATRSCGCFDMERMTTHGLSRTPEYQSWQGMQSRCHNPREPGYCLYGARGIIVCDRWRDSFQQFFSDMGPKPAPNMSIDRILVNGPYSPMNCRWATPLEQVNNRRNTRLVAINGITKPLKQWCKELGTPYQVALKRIWRGVPAEIAATTKGHGLRGTQYHADWK